MTTYPNPGGNTPGHTHTERVCNKPLDRMALPCEDSLVTNTRIPRRVNPTISTVTTWHNDGLWASHSTRHCTMWGTPRDHRHPRDQWARTTQTTKPMAWICAACVDDDPSEPDRVTRVGNATCESCDRTLRVTSFPTALVAGVGQIRDMRVCRACRKSGVHVRDDVGTDPNDPMALAAAIASDWRPTGPRTPALSDTDARAMHRTTTQATRVA